MSIVTLLRSAVSGWRGEGCSAVVRFLLRGFGVLAAATAMAWGEEPPRVLMLFSNDRLLPAEPALR